MIDKNYDEFLETTGASRNLVEDINNSNFPHYFRE